MITKVHLQNFRCFADHTIPLRELSVIVGRNNAGKSSLVDALRLLAIVTGRYRRLQIRPAPSRLEVPKAYRGVAPSVDGVEVTLDTVFHRYNEPPAIVTAWFASGDSIRLYLGKSGQVFAVLFDRRGEVAGTPGRLAGLQIDPVSALPQVAPFLKEENVLGSDYVKRFMNTDRAPLHFRNELLLFPQAYQRFKELAEATWPKLRIDELQLSGQQLQLFVRDDDFTAEVSWMGHGLQMWLQVMWFVARTDRQSSVILDEPDVYLHADLQRKLIRLVRKHYRQTLVATHSVEMMSEVEPENVLVIDRRRAESRFTSSLPAVQRVIERIGGVHNLHLARLWSSKKCLLLEGKDIAFLRRWQSALFPETSESFDALPHASIGGWSGWPYAIGSRLILRNAIGEEIRVYCVLDRDYHSSEQVSKRSEEAKERGVQLHVWSRKEIENYLLVPAMIARVISELNESGRQGPSVEEVTECLGRLADGLRGDVLDAQVAELAADRRNNVARASRLARDRVDEAWLSFEGKMALVPGKQMVSSLSAWSQASYGVALSAVRLAGSFSMGEVPAEVVTVVTAIETGAFFESDDAAAGGKRQP